MGNVRTEQIKRTAKDLMKRYPAKFSDNFENNKHAVNSLVQGGTPKVLNQIAGYITRFLAAEKRQMQAESPEDAGSEEAELAEEAPEGS